MHLQASYQMSSLCSLISCCLSLYKLQRHTSEETSEISATAEIIVSIYSCYMSSMQPIDEWKKSSNIQSWITKKTQQTLSHKDVRGTGLFGTPFYLVAASRVVCPRYLPLKTECPVTAEVIRLHLQGRSIAMEANIKDRVACLTIQTLLLLRSASL